MYHLTVYMLDKTNIRRNVCMRINTIEKIVKIIKWNKSVLNRKRNSFFPKKLQLILYYNIIIILYFI